MAEVKTLKRPLYVLVKPYWQTGRESFSILSYTLIISPTNSAVPPACARRSDYNSSTSALVDLQCSTAQSELLVLWNGCIWPCPCPAIRHLAVVNTAEIPTYKTLTHIQRLAPTRRSPASCSSAYICLTWQRLDGGTPGREAARERERKRERTEILGWFNLFSPPLLLDQGFKPYTY